MSKDLKEPLIEEPAVPLAQAKVPSYFSLFRYADGKEKMMMIIGIVCAIGSGASTPFFLIFFSDITMIFLQEKREEAEAEALNVMVKFFIIGAATWFLNFIALYCWNITGSRQSSRFKKLYYEHLLKQEVAWYDSKDVNKLATQISNNMVAIEGATGEKVPLLVTTMITTVFGFFYAFFKCWRLSLILTALLPLLMLGGVLMMKGMTMSHMKSKASYQNAAGVAEQAFGGIRTVKSLVGEAFEHGKFLTALNTDQSTVMKYNIFSSASFGIMNLIFLSIYSLGFWYGKNLIIWYSDQYDSATILSTFFCFVVGGSSIGQISPIMKNIVEGKVAAGKFYSLIQRKKSMVESDDPVVLKKVQEIELKNISFKYDKIKEQENQPAPEKKKQDEITEQSINDSSKESEEVPLVLDNVSIKIPHGKVTAIVGESGSGKSTIIQLLMRYYDPSMGAVKVNGVDMKDLDLDVYRRMIGFVGQQPVLFSMSVAENIRLSDDNLTDAEIQSILKKANAWEFIENSDEKLQTYVGSSGTQLSGGQKQRIAIARAIAKKPSLLILDEATSALDRKNEKEIQKTLSNLSSGNITTVVIAHRLSTIRGADNIIVLGKGQVIEQGRHNQLTNKKGVYYDLVKSQMAAQDKQIEMVDSEKSEKADSKGDLKKEVQEALKTEEKKKQEFSEQELKGVFSKLFRYNRENWGLLIVGCLAAFSNGLIWPLFNIAFSNIMALLAFAEQNSEQIDKYCLLFLGIAIGGGLCTFLYKVCFEVAGSKLVFQLRERLFSKILHLPVPFFDSPENTPGALSTKLSQNTYDIHNMVSGLLAVGCLNISTVTVSMIIAFTHSWKLTLVTCGLAPLLVITSAINMALLKNLTQKSEKFEKAVGSLISDSVCNIRTVKSFGQDQLFLARFNSKLNEISRVAEEKAFKTSFLQGLSRGSIMFVEGLTFYIGGILFTNYQINDPQSIYIAIFSVIFAAVGVGQNSQFMPDMGKAKHAGASVFKILETKDEKEISEEKEDRLLQTFNGDIEFRNVLFKYPQRDAVVLDHFNLKIKKGEKIGFCGPSGSGKSTIIQLLLRFYQIQEGEILIDGQNIEKYNLYKYRKQLGLVSQEPNLFLGTVKQNIIYNLDKVENTDDQVERCVRISHAHTFINQWEQKFDKEVGQKGTQVSGGQKQRIALSRCLIRHPKMFLLDESTSALDTDTQRIVFQNLKPILKNHTSISIAHRLSTIEDADRIIVMRDGRIIEDGKYDELMQLGENFYRLAKGIN